MGGRERNIVGERERDDKTQEESEVSLPCSLFISLFHSPTLSFTFLPLLLSSSLSLSLSLSLIDIYLTFILKMS